MDEKVEGYGSGRQGRWMRKLKVMEVRGEGETNGRIGENCDLCSG